MFNTKGSSLKYFKTLDIYKSSNGNNFVDLKTGQAVSYKWWTYAIKHPKKKNTILFNNYPYSVTTSGHQRAAINLFKEKGFKIEYIDLGSASLTYDKFLSIAPKLVIDKIVDLHIQMNKKGSKKKVNEERINSIKHHVKELERLVKLRCIVTLKEIEDAVNLGLNNYFDVMSSIVESNKEHTEKERLNKEKLINAKKSLDNFDEITLVSETINNLDEVSL